MAKKQNGKGNGKLMSHHYCDIASTSMATTNPGYVQIQHVIATLLETIAGAGSEADIQRAILNVQAICAEQIASYGFYVDVVFAVSDTVFTNGDGGSASLSTALDARNAGEFEFELLGSKLASAKGGFLNTTPRVVNEAYFRIDITRQLRKAAQMLARSAVLDFSPIITILIRAGGVNAPTVLVNSYIDVNYVTRPRPLRMLV